MKKLFREFFYVPKHGNGKVREKVVLARIAVYITIILVCMAAMSFTAYAYFSASVSSGVNNIQAASYDLDIVSLDGLVGENNFYTLDNSDGSNSKEYKFTLTKSAASTASVGYGKIEIKTDINTDQTSQLFYTEPIGKFQVNGEPVTDNDRTVTITVPAGKSARVWFISEWGTCAKEPIIEESNGILPQYDGYTENVVSEDNTEDDENTVSDENNTVSQEEQPPSDNTPENTDTPITDITASSETENGQTSDSEDISDVPEAEEGQQENDTSDSTEENN